MTIVKTLKFKPCLKFRACLKKIVEFTDSTHAIYKNSKNSLKSSIQLTITFLYMSVLNTFQYKHCLYFDTSKV